MKQARHILWLKGTLAAWRTMLKGTLAVCLAMLLSSCQHKELCYDHSHIMEVDVVFDWCNAPEASPESMALYLFPQDGGRVLKYDFAGCSGGRIRVSNGVYDAICLNSDTYDICVLDDDRYESLRISTKDLEESSGLSSIGIFSRIPTAAEEKLATPPETIWSACAENIILGESARTVTLSPVLNVINCAVEIRNADNLRWINNISGSLSGMSDSYMPQLSTSSDECATLIFGCNYNIEESVIYGQLSTFGHCPSENNIHTLTIYVTLADDSSWEYTFDVTQQIHESEDQYNLRIILDELPIPKPVMNGGGFKPVVSEWGEVEIDINM